MGGFFGAVASRDSVLDVFFGVDYHSHLGTHRAGMASWDEKESFKRCIHNIESTPFRTCFEKDLEELKGNACIACISDKEPQPILFRSRLGVYAISVIGCVNNRKELSDELLAKEGGHFEALGGGKVSIVELIASLINSKPTFHEGIAYAQEKIDGTACIMILTDRGSIIVARDRLGRLPVLLGKSEDGYCAAFESFSFNKLGYEDYRALGPGECVEMTADGITVLNKPGTKERFCAFMWTYYGYPTSQYTGTSVEVVRSNGGKIMAKHDAERGIAQDCDGVCGVPDSGIAYAAGYSAESKLPFTRPFIKYTPTWPRSFMPSTSALRHKIAKMKMIPVRDNIEGKKLLLIDDSIVRGTQLNETVDFLYSNGAKEVHMRSACPPIMFPCKYLNFSGETGFEDLISRRVIKQLEGPEGENHIEEYADGDTERGKALRQCICKQMGFDSLEFQTLQGIVESCGVSEDCICTYCWTGKE